MNDDVLLDAMEADYNQNWTEIKDSIYQSDLWIDGRIYSVKIKAERFNENGKELADITILEIKEVFRAIN